MAADPALAALAKKKDVHSAIERGAKDFAGHAGDWPNSVDMPRGFYTAPDGSGVMDHFWVGRDGSFLLGQFSFLMDPMTVLKYDDYYPPWCDLEILDCAMFTIREPGYRNWGDLEFLDWDWDWGLDLVWVQAGGRKHARGALSSLGPHHREHPRCVGLLSCCLVCQFLFVSSVLTWIPNICKSLPLTEVYMGSL